jgi:hypothetical protein
MSILYYGISSSMVEYFRHMLFIEKAYESEQNRDSRPAIRAISGIETD